jgi:dsRNA-specific ribonuclease
MTLNHVILVRIQVRQLDRQYINAILFLVQNNSANLEGGSMGRFAGKWALEQMNPQNLETAQVLIGRKFNNLSLLALALTHKSCSGLPARSNEALEFLGDIWLDDAVESYISKNYPSLKDEQFGRMRGRLRSNRLLAIVAEQLGLISVLLIAGYGVEYFNQPKYRTKVMADLFEAILGALFIDGGREAMESFLARTLFLRAQEVFEELDKPLLIDTKFGNYLSPDNKS